MGFSRMFQDFDSYTIREPLYTIIILAAVLFGINGIVLLIRGILAETKGMDAPDSKSGKADNNHGTDVATQLEKLANLKEKGLLSQIEFDVQKRKLLERK